MDKKKLSFKDIMINYGVIIIVVLLVDLYRYYFKELLKC